MQQILYDDWPYAVTYYYDNLIAYRTDRFEGFLPQPDPNGSYLFQYGTWTYENLKPVAAARGSRADRRPRSSAASWQLSRSSAVWRSCC